MSLLTNSAKDNHVDDPTVIHPRDLMRKLEIPLDPAHLRIG